jgi:hypothetical protein
MDQPTAKQALQGVSFNRRRVRSIQAAPTLVGRAWRGL